MSDEEEEEEVGGELAANQFWQIDGNCPACHGPIYVVSAWPIRDGAPPRPIHYHDPACGSSRGRMFMRDAGTMVPLVDWSAVYPQRTF